VGSIFFAAAAGAAASSPGEGGFTGSIEIGNDRSLYMDWPALCRAELALRHVQSAGPDHSPGAASRAAAALAAPEVGVFVMPKSQRAIFTEN
jgi:hypothetical protein